MWRIGGDSIILEDQVFLGFFYIFILSATIIPIFSYERVDPSNILSCFVVGRPRPEYGLPVAVIENLLN